MFSIKCGEHVQRVLQAGKSGRNLSSKFNKRFKFIKRFNKNFINLESVRNGAISQTCATITEIHY